MLPFETEFIYSQNFSSPLTFTTNTSKRTKRKKKNVTTDALKHVIVARSRVPRYTCDKNINQCLRTQEAINVCKKP